MDWPMKLTQLWVRFMSNHCQSCWITLAPFYLVLLHPYVPSQLHFHTAHHPLEKTPVAHCKGSVLVVSLVFLQHFCLLLFSFNIFVCFTLSARCIPPANNRSLPSAPLFTRCTSWIPVQSFGFGFFSLSTPPVFPCCKDYLYSVFSQSHRQGRLVWQWLWVFLHVAEPQVVPPGGRGGVKALSCCKCPADAVAVSPTFLSLAANVQEPC